MNIIATVGLTLNPIRNNLNPLFPMRFFVSGGAPLSQEIGEFFAAADIIILDRNLFQIPTYEIHNASVVQTIFNGEIIYKKGEVDEF